MNGKSIEIFTNTNINELKWCIYKNGNSLRQIFLPLIEKGIQNYIRNAKCDIGFIGINDTLIPFSITDEYINGNSYICSPTAQYIDYGRDELKVIGKEHSFQWFLLYPIEWILRFIAKASKMDKVIMVNNFFLSTNLYQTLPPEMMETITKLLVEKFPDHSILFRSLNREYNGDLMCELTEIGYQAVFSRYIYLYPDINKKIKGKIKNTMSRDEKKRLENGLEWQSVEPGEYESIKNIELLYNKLYIERYSTNNPNYTKEFIGLLNDTDLFYFWTLKENEVVKAALGVFIIDDTISAPLVGHNTYEERTKGLYRAIFTKSFDESVLRKKRIHGSAGAGDFKRSRGYVGCVEYHFLYTKHLKPYRHWLYSLIQWVGNKFMVPYIEKNRL